MKIALIALSVRGAMGDYIECLVNSLSECVELYLFVPEHYTGKTGKATVIFFSTGSKKIQAFYRLINPYLASKVWKSIENIQPDVVHLFNGEGYPWSLFWAYWSIQKSLPMVVTVHDPQAHPGNILEAINSYLRHFTLSRASRVHIHSQRFLDDVIRQGVQAKKVCVIPHGCIADRFLSHRRVEVCRERVVLFFGRLEGYKGLDVLVEAGLGVQDDFRVVIAGPGHLPQNILKTIQMYPNIFELRNYFLSENEVAYLFQIASVCVLPYHQATQSSIPLIAAAFGVPVVATSVGTFVEDVTLVNGLLIPPANPKALAEGIRKAVDRIPYYPGEYKFDALKKRFVDIYTSICR